MSASMEIGAASEEDPKQSRAAATAARKVKVSLTPGRPHIFCTAQRVFPATRHEKGGQHTRIPNHDSSALAPATVLSNLMDIDGLGGAVLYGRTRACHDFH